MKANDNLFIGLMIGATIPLVGYWLIEQLFAILSSQGIMDEVTSSTMFKRQKTLALLGICSNLLPAQIANNKRYVSMLKGIVIATFVYTALWVYHFYGHMIF